tara:strand:- start:1796 stop:2182 length:387 start_codon:yes stop_codon:yes gene_type:complete
MVISTPRLPVSTSSFSDASGAVPSHRKARPLSTASTGKRSRWPLPMIAISAWAPSSARAKRVKRIAGFCGPFLLGSAHAIAASGGWPGMPYSNRIGCALGAHTAPVASGEGCGSLAKRAVSGGSVRPS